jgi:hypothetical protein
MIGDIDVLEECLVFLALHLLHVPFDLFFHLFALLCISSLVEDGVSHLDDFEVESVVPVSHERLHLFFLVEGRRE